jgi:hypothetical protein
MTPRMQHHRQGISAGPHEHAAAVDNTARPLQQLPHAPSAAAVCSERCEPAGPTWATSCNSEPIFLAGRDKDILAELMTTPTNF